jgi:acetyl-CoA synthetase
MITDAAGARKLRHPETARRAPRRGRRAPDFSPYEDTLAAPAVLERTPTLASDPLLLYFTSGTTAQPKLVLHTHASYPIGHLSTMFWLGLREGDRHHNISSPGWGEARLVELLRTLERGARRSWVHDQTRFSAQARAR